MNMFKKNGGFTLVELIVVIAILAILAAVAIPAYSGYITKAQDAGDTTALASIKTAVQGALATKGAVTEIEVKTDSNGKVNEVTAKIGTAVYELVKDGATVTTATSGNSCEGATDFWAYMNKEMPTLKGSFKAHGADWNNTAAAGANQGKWVAKTA